MSPPRRDRATARSNERALLARTPRGRSAPDRRGTKTSQKAGRTKDPRIELARRRVGVAKRALGVAAILGFGAAMALARTTYAGHPKQRPRPLSAPTGFVRIVRKNQLQAGIMAPAQAPPGAATGLS